MKISIIIPVLNEAAHVSKLLSHLNQNVSPENYVEEILFVDGGSTDNTVQTVNRYLKSTEKSISTRLIKTKKGRAKQMNSGALAAKGDLLYFLHADSLPPLNYDYFISQEVQKNNYAGCFRMKFDSTHLWLRFLGWMTRFKHKACRGGDQSLFITKKLFEQLNGYNEDFIIYEDNEFISRLFDINTFVVIPHNIITSARKYKEVGVWRLQYYFLSIHLKRFFGASPRELNDYYLNKLNSSF